MGVIVGGLVGDNLSGIIMSCYSTGLVSGSRIVGGLVGDNLGNILNCFWDIDVSGQQESDGGTGLHSSESMNIDTYLDAGWDFMGEIANGTDDVWRMPEGDYPRLWWE